MYLGLGIKAFKCKIIYIKKGKVFGGDSIYYWVCHLEGRGGGYFIWFNGHLDQL